MLAGTTFGLVPSTLIVEPTRDTREGYEILQTCTSTIVVRPCLTESYTSRNVSTDAHGVIYEHPLRIEDEFFDFIKLRSHGYHR